MPSFLLCFLRRRYSRRNASMHRAQANVDPCCWGVTSEMRSSRQFIRWNACLSLKILGLKISGQVRQVPSILQVVSRTCILQVTTSTICKCGSKRDHKTKMFPRRVSSVTVQRLRDRRVSFCHCGLCDLFDLHPWTRALSLQRVHHRLSCNAVASVRRKLQQCPFHPYAGQPLSSE